MSRASRVAQKAAQTLLSIYTPLGQRPLLLEGAAQQREHQRNAREPAQRVLFLEEGEQGLPALAVREPHAEESFDLRRLEPHQSQLLRAGKELAAVADQA